MESKYHYINESGAQFGPLTLEELIGAGITPETYVWYPELTEWKQAKDAPEVAAALQSAAPAVAPGRPYSPAGNFQEYDEPMPNSYLGWSIAACFMCCMPAAVVAVIYATQVSGKWYSGDREGARRSASLAKSWFWASVIVGLVGGLLYIAAVFFSAFYSAF